MSRILAEIVTLGHNRLRNVYDPTCGSGSLLIRAANIGNAVEIFGQEKNPTTYNLARMNMLLHGIKFSNFKIENGDTLEADAFGDKQFDAVVANPPFSADGVLPINSTMMTDSAKPDVWLPAKQPTMLLSFT